MKTLLSLLTFVLICSVALESVSAQEFGRQGRGRGHGLRQGQQHGLHGREDSRSQNDHETFHFLLENHEKISREVKQLPNGVETLTESQDAEVARKIREHVKWMDYRVEHQQPIRMRDPLFAELFRHAKSIQIDFEKTDQGVRVTETSKDPEVVKLIKAHAKVVSAFVEKGYEEARTNHAVPGKETSDAEMIHPGIKQYGAVVRLSDAVQQPRPKTKIVVDMTAGGDTSKLFPSVDKLARFVNIYQGAGTKPADLQIAVVMHGDATYAALNDEAYAERFETDDNPHLDCLQALHEAGVELYVCGQSLVRKGAKPEEAVVFIDVAVSGLTSVVNLQADGYQYFPLLK